MSKRPADDLHDSEGDDQPPHHPPRNKRPARPRKLSPLLHKATVKDLAETETIRVTSSTADLDDAIIERIKKCLARGNHPNTPVAEAKAALHIASQLMGRYNVSQAEILAHEPPSAQQQYAGQSTVSIHRADGDKTKAVRHQGFVNNLGHAMCTFFDCKFYSTARRASLDYTFYGIAQNTVTAAMSFEMIYNLITEWARPYKGVSSKADYSLGVSDELLRMAQKEKVTEAAEAEKAEKREIAARSEQEEAEKRAHLNRLAAVSDLDMVSSPESATKMEACGDQDEKSGSPRLNGETFDLSPGHESEDDDQSDDDSIEPDFKVEDDDRISVFSDLDEEINNLVKPEPQSPEPSFRHLPTQPSPPKQESASISPKQELEVESKWSSRMQLTTFRATASKIAEDYLAGQDFKLRHRSTRSKAIRDRAAYSNGVKDSKKIDVRQKRIGA